MPWLELLPTPNSVRYRQPFQKSRHMRKNLAHSIRLRHHIILFIIRSVLTLKLVWAIKVLGELTIPASVAIWICWLRAFAVTAITGTCLIISPLFWSSLILRTHVNPSMIGISRSINTIERWWPCSFPAQKLVFWMNSIASRPWFAMLTWYPLFRSCLTNTFWFLDWVSNRCEDMGFGWLTWCYPQQ